MTNADSEVTMGMYKGFYVSLIILFYNDVALNNIASNNVSIISINMNKVIKIIHLLCNSMIIAGTGLNDEIGFKYTEQAVKPGVKKTKKTNIFLT